MDKQKRLRKVNMVMGAFFTEVETRLLTYISDLDPELESIRSSLVVEEDWSDEEFSRVSKSLKSYGYGLQPSLGVDEALGGVDQHPALRDESNVLMVDFAIAPVGLGAHGLEPPAAAECWLKAVASRLLDNERNPGVGIRKEDYVRVVDLDELQ